MLEQGRRRWRSSGKCKWAQVESVVLQKEATAVGAVTAAGALAVAMATCAAVAAVGGRY